MSALPLNYGSLFYDQVQENNEVMNIDRSELEAFEASPAFYEDWKNVEEQFALMVPDDQAPLIRISQPTHYEADNSVDAVYNEKSAAQLYDSLNQGMDMTDSQRDEHIKQLEKYEMSCLMSPISQPTSPVRSRSHSTADATVPEYCLSSPSISPAQPEEAPLAILESILEPVPQQRQPSFEWQDLVEFISQQPEAADLLARQLAAVTEAPAVVALPVETPVRGDDLMNEIESILETASQSAPSPAAYDSDSTWSQSPQHSTCSDEDYSPDPVPKRRGRKRKADPEFTELATHQKKQKNAQAAARYRQKKKDLEEQAAVEVEKYEDALDETAKKYNAVLQKRNLMLEMIIESVEKQGIKLNLRQDLRKLYEEGKK